MTGIYQIINKINEHAYVGSAVDIERRWTWHKSRLNKDKHYNTYLQHAWNKYGKENFELRIVERADKSKILEIEQHYLDTLNPAYNISPTAGGGDQGEEARRKISLASKGNKSNLGRSFSEEHKRRIALAHTGKCFISKEGRKSISEKAKIRLADKKNHPMYGKHHGEETKRKISDTLKRNNLKEIN